MITYTFYQMYKMILVWLGWTEFQAGNLAWFPTFLTWAAILSVLVPVVCEIWEEVKPDVMKWLHGIGSDEDCNHSHVA